MLGNLGFPEILIIMVIVLLLFGAKRIPEIAGSMGKGIKEFKKNINEADRSIREPLRDSLSDSSPSDRLGAGDTTARREEEAVRPEPKRLM